MRFEALPALGKALRAAHPGVELLAQEMWNAQMPGAFRRGSIDIALSLCPEIAAELELETVDREHLVALLPERHPLGREGAIPLASLADEEFVLFPREIAPRLHDAFMAIYRRAGFEPRIRSESFHTGWELDVLADIHAAALAPESIVRAMPDGIVAVALSEPTDSLDTCLLWRADERSPVVEACLASARAAFRIAAAAP
jgi:DNA-binding transcriptional LysR family regulator